MSHSEQKKNRVLDIFFRALKGEDISIARIANEYGVSNKSISRDINEIKNFLADNRELVGNTELEYSYQSKTYHLVYDNFLISKELIAIVKILIGSRALSKMELLKIISKLKNLTTYQDRNLLERIIQKEVYHYNEVHHDCNSVIDNLWQLTRIIDEQIEITITYYKQDRSMVERRLQPIAIVFSEYYFYLLAYKEGNNKNPQYFRVDRMTNIVEHRQHFELDLSQSFDEGQLKEKIQYMYPGVYRKIKFEFTGPSVQAILDKMPTAKIIDVQGNKKIIEANVYGRGVNMFLLSQGSWVKVLEPQEFVDEMKEEVLKLYQAYQ